MTQLQKNCGHLASAVKTLARDGVLVAFVVAWLTSLITLCLPPDAAIRWNGADGLTLILAALTGLFALGRQLPWQNVITVAVIVTLVSSGLLLAGNFTGIPVGPLTRVTFLGIQIPGPVPGAFLATWVTGVLTSYGVAQLLLWRHRFGRHYGWWLMGLTGLLVVAQGLAWEPFAVQVKGHWAWPTRVSGLNWYSIPWESLAGRLLATFTSLILATPWLIDKRGIASPPLYQPLILWCLLNLLCAVGCCLRHLWLAAVLNLAVTLVIWMRAPDSIKESRTKT